MSQYRPCKVFYVNSVHKIKKESDKEGKRKDSNLVVGCRAFTHNTLKHCEKYMVLMNS